LHARHHGLRCARTKKALNIFVGAASDGLFHYLAIEEAAIRTNPAARTTDLLKKVFG
jgi:hypothetical protein